MSGHKPYGERAPIGDEKLSLSVAKRTEACLHLLRHDFDIDGTVQWAIREYAEDPAMERANNKEKLARNIVTIGGNGDQQALNLVAFQQALARHADERRRKVVATHEQEIAALKSDLRKAEDRADEMARDYREQVAKVQSLQQRMLPEHAEAVPA